MWVESLVATRAPLLERSFKVPIWTSEQKGNIVGFAGWPDGR
jgi:hypothetical protein